MTINNDATNVTHKSGFVAFVGRPNAGKSTLTNALVGQKVAITSGRPQTTRHTVRGIINAPGHQLIIVDTPGLHRPRTLLGERLNTVVKDTLSDVDVIGFCLPADQKVGPGDRFIAEQLQVLLSGRGNTPLIAIATKTDLVSKQRVAEHLMDISKLGDWAEIIPVSAKDGFQVETLRDLFVAHLRPGPKFYAEDELTDEPLEVMVAELVREAALEGVHQELPHSIAVVVEEMNNRPKGKGVLTEIRAIIYVERDSQKGIIIGKGGQRLRDVGIKARAEIQKMIDTDKVFLDLRVKVANNWQTDPKQLQKMGF